MKNRKTDIPEDIYQDEVVLFFAGGYHTTPQIVLRRYLEQYSQAPEAAPEPFRLEENEMTILRDMLSKTNK